MGLSFVCLNEKALTKPDLLHLADAGAGTVIVKYALTSQLDSKFIFLEAIEVYPSSKT